MPTGYTAPVMEGKITDVKDFATTCARAFGAFIHQRDDSPAAELRYPEPPDNSFYTESLAKAKSDSLKWSSTTEEERYAQWSDYVREQEIARHNSLAALSEKRARYEKMLAQVVAIEVPSNLESFKQFMIDQLNESIKFDCGDGRFENDYYKSLPFYKWCEEKDKRMIRDVIFYTEQLNKERKRYEEQVRYINDMVETFGIRVAT